MQQEKLLLRLSVHRYGACEVENVKKRYVELLCYHWQLFHRTCYREKTSERAGRPGKLLVWERSRENDMNAAYFYIHSNMVVFYFP